MRKTRLIQQLEAKHEKPIERIVTDALTANDGSITSAANSLNVNVNTFYYWVIRLGIKTKTIAFVA